MQWVFPGIWDGGQPPGPQHISVDGSSRSSGALWDSLHTWKGEGKEICLQGQALNATRGSHSCLGCVWSLLQVLSQESPPPGVLSRSPPSLRTPKLSTQRWAAACRPMPIAGRRQGQDGNLGGPARAWPGHLADWAGLETRRQKVRCAFHTDLARRAVLRALAERGRTGFQRAGKGLSLCGAGRKASRSLREEPRAVGVSSAHGAAAGPPPE